MPNIIVILISFIAFFISTVQGAQIPVKTSLNIVGDEWPPFSTGYHPDKGLSIAIVKMALERSDYKVDAEIVPFPRILLGIEHGTYDVIAITYHDDELASHIYYGESYYSTPIRVLRKKGTQINFTQYDDLKGKSIATSIGYQYTPRFDADKSLNKIETLKTWNCLRMLAAGRVDLSLESVDVVNHLFQKSAEGKDISAQIEFIGPVIGESKIYMGVSKKRNDATIIIKKFNEALAQMIIDGSYQKLVNGYIKN